jgi:hypothetical protein
MKESAGSRGLGIAVIATPLLWLAAEGYSPPLRVDARAQLDAIADNPQGWYWYTVLLVAGLIALVPAALGLGRLAASGSRRVARIGSLLMAFSAVVAVADAMTQLVTWQMVADGADRAQMAALLERYDSSPGASIFFLPGGLAYMVATVLLTIALLRTDDVPGWAGISLGLGLLVNLAGFMASSVALIAIGAAVMVPASVVLGRRLLVDDPAPVDRRTAVLVNEPSRAG